MMKFIVATFWAFAVAACDHVDEVTPQKYVGLVVAHAAPVKMEIAKALRANPGKPVPQAGVLRLATPTGVAPVEFDFAWVTSGGAIVVQSNRYGVVLLQEPVVTPNGIEWSCVVHPATAKPSLCGSSYENSMLKSN